MPSDESKLFLELKGKLENLSGGVAKHSSEVNFPQNIKKEVLDAKVVELNVKRKDYDDASNIAHQKSDEYDKVFKECEDLFSNVSMQLYGAYGKQNLIVEDFGLKIYKKPSGRKPKNSAVVN